MCSAPHLLPAISVLFPLCSSLQWRRAGSALEHSAFQGVWFGSGVKHVALCLCQDLRGLSSTSHPGAAAEESVRAPAGGPWLPASQPSVPESHSLLWGENTEKFFKLNLWIHVYECTDFHYAMYKQDINIQGNFVFKRSSLYLIVWNRSDFTGVFFL